MTSEDWSSLYTTEAAPSLIASSSAPVAEAFDAIGGSQGIADIFSPPGDDYDWDAATSTWKRREPVAAFNWTPPPQYALPEIVGPTTTSYDGGVSAPTSQNFLDPAWLPFDEEQRAMGQPDAGAGMFGPMAPDYQGNAAGRSIIDNPEMMAQDVRFDASVDPANRQMDRLGDFAAWANRPIGFLEDAQRIAGDVGGYALPAIIPGGQAIDAISGALGGGNPVSDVGRFAAETAVPTRPWEVGLELLPGVGTVPDALRAGRAGVRALDNAAVAGLRNLDEAAPALRTALREGETGAVVMPGGGDWPAGRWFTDQPQGAADIARFGGGEVRYVDVPEAVARQATHPEPGTFVLPAELSNAASPSGIDLADLTPAEAARMLTEQLPPVPAGHVRLYRGMDVPESSRRAAGLGGAPPNVPPPVTPGGGGSGVTPVGYPPGTPGAAKTPIERITAAVRTANKLRPEQKEARSLELSTRVGRMASDLEKATTADEAFSARTALRDELPRAEYDAPTLAQNEIDDLMIGVAQSKNLPPLSRLGAMDALQDIMAGLVPQPAALQKLEKVYPDLAKAVAAKRANGWQTVKDNVIGLMGIPQSMQTFGDLSGTLRQAAIPGFGNPRDYWRSIQREVNVFFAKPGAAGEKARQAADELLKNPWISGSSDKAGYSFEEVGGHMYSSSRFADAADRAGGFTSINDSFLARVNQKVPLMARSQDAMVTILNQIGGRVYAKEAQRLWDNGIREIGQYEALARVINHGRGYGSWPAPDLIKGVNAFFSPRFLSSRAELFIDPFKEFARGNTAAGKLASKNLVSFIGTNAAIVEFGAQMGMWETTWDPLDTDFGKIKIGNTRIDPWAGIAPLARFTARMSALGLNEIGVDTGYEYRGGAKGQLGLLAKDFVSGKLGPIPSFLAEAFGLKQPYDDKGLFTPERLVSMFTPFIANSVKDELETGGIGGIKGAAIVGSASFWGEGTLAYPPTPYAQTDAQLQKDIKDGLLPATYKDADNKEQPLTSYGQLTKEQQTAFDARHGSLAAQRAETASPAIKALKGEQANYADLQNSVDNILFGQEWRDARRSVKDQQRGALDRVERQYQSYFNELDTKEPQNLEDAVMRDYMAAINTNTQNAIVNWDGVDRVVAGWHPDAQAALVATRLNSGSAKEKEYYADISKLEPYFEVRDQAWLAFAAKNENYSAYATFDDYATALADKVKAANPNTSPASIEKAVAKALSDLSSQFGQQATAYLLKNRELIDLLYKHGYSVPSQLAPLVSPGAR